MFCPNGLSRDHPKAGEAPVTTSEGGFEKVEIPCRTVGLRYASGLCQNAPWNPSLQSCGIGTLETVISPSLGELVDARKLLSVEIYDLWMVA